MAPSSTLSSKGQITVPLEIRHRLGLKEGDRVEFVVDEGRTILRPARPAKNPFEFYVGALPAFSGTDAINDINDWIHELRDQEPR